MLYARKQSSKKYLNKIQYNAKSGSIKLVLVVMSLVTLGGLYNFNLLGDLGWVI